MTASANAPVLALLEEGDPRCGAEMKRPKPPSEATEDLALRPEGQFGQSGPSKVSHNTLTRLGSIEGAKIATPD
jgi:hypothetical protein